MIKFRNERVISFSRDYLDLYWEIDPTTEDIQEYQFFVERSESEAGPWLQIAGPLTDRYYLRDDDVHQLSNTRVYFYRVRALHTPSGTELFSKIVDRRGTEDLIAAEIIRNEAVLFQEFVGVRCWLFPIRTFGMRCPQCFDEVLQKRTQDSCPTCWNTQFAGGYHFPIEFWGQIDLPETAEQQSIEDHRQTKYFVLRCNPSPYIKPLDLVIDHQNQRYRIMSVHGTFRLGVPVRQEIRMVQVQKGSVEDKIPLRVDESSLTLVPRRNFYNPHTLEAADPQFNTDAVFRLYKY
jgi:hypothetical protein